jgi:LCP family protein required for cell wall assembly
LTIAGIVALGLISVLVGYAAFMHRNPVAAVTHTVTQIFVPSPQQVFGKNNLLVLVEGLDYDYNAKDEEYSTNSRSDVIWAVNLDFANKRVYQLSIPRDMIATLPNGRQAKINEAQSDGGVNEAKNVIGQWLGIPEFDRYAILRINATKEFVTAIGGVDIYVKSSNCLQYRRGCTGDTLDYDDTWGHLHIHLKEGMQHLDGERAVGYMRFREDWCSDPCRIMRQQQVLHAMINKLKGDRINTVLHIGSLIGAVHRNVQTDFTDSEMLSIANYFQGIPSSAIVSNQVPYVNDINLPGQGDSLVPDTAARAHLVATMLVAAPSPIPSPSAVALAAISPGMLRVDVENGSGVSGAARHVADVLRQAGFTIGEVSDADRSDYGATEIHQHSSVTFAAAKVRSALPQDLRAAVIVPDPASNGTPVSTPPANSDVTVIVGSDLAKKSAPALPDHS